ncbi:MAG TPA: hypothetical protein VKM93_21235 [Terriglobia bacterium]|nr:hypothetical protein [Terriglobia bacterium]
MDRRQFLEDSLATAGGAWLGSRGLADGAPAVPGQVPGAVASAEIGSARFPAGFIWDAATDVGTEYLS